MENNVRTLNKEITHDYDDLGHRICTHEKHASGYYEETTYTYNGDKLLYKVKSDESREKTMTTYAYGECLNDRGKLTRECEIPIETDHMRGLYITDYTYDSDGKLVTKSTDYVIRDDGHGKFHDSIIEKYQYNNNGQLWFKQENNCEGSFETEYIYNDGKLIGVCCCDRHCNDVYDETHYYGLNGELIMIERDVYDDTVFHAVCKKEYIEYEYDTNGNCIREMYYSMAMDKGCDYEDIL